MGLDLKMLDPPNEVLCYGSAQAASAAHKAEQMLISGDQWTPLRNPASAVYAQAQVTGTAYSWHPTVFGPVHEGAMKARSFECSTDDCCPVTRWSRPVPLLTAVGCPSGVHQLPADLSAACKPRLVLKGLCHSQQVVPTAAPLALEDVYQGCRGRTLSHIHVHRLSGGSAPNLFFCGRFPICNCAPQMIAPDLTSISSSTSLCLDEKRTPPHKWGSRH